MRQDCKYFESRTYPNGDTVRKCDLDLAPEAPWRCPDDCPKYTRRRADVNWSHGSLVTPQTPPEPASLGDDDTIGDLLDAAEDIVNAAAPEVLADLERERRKRGRGGPKPGSGKGKGKKPKKGGGSLGDRLREAVPRRELSCTRSRRDAARALPGPGWLSARRAEAAERFASMAPPTPAAEEWRYSPIADLDLGSYSMAANGSELPPADSVAYGAAGVIDCVNGRIVATRSLDSLAAAGVVVGSVSDIDGGAELLGSVADDAADHFTVLNDAFAPEPVVIDVADGVTVGEPIVVLNRTVGDGAAVFPRLVVRVGADADVKIYDVQHSSGPVLVAPVVELDVGPAGRLGYLNMQGLGDGAWQLGSHLARVDRDATLTAASAGMGGAYARTRTDARLVGRGASGDLLSLYFGSGSQMLDFRTFQDHAAPDTTSKLLYKGSGGRLFPQHLQRPDPGEA